MTSSGTAPIIDDVFSEILDVKVLRPGSYQKHYKSSTEFVSDLRDYRDGYGDTMTLISFHSPATCLPIKASRSDFEYLQHQYNIHPEFLNALAAFGRFPDPANGYVVSPTVCKQSTEKHRLGGIFENPHPDSFELWYRLQYPERNNRSIENPWSIRQTGVYHQYEAHLRRSLIILIHPSRDTILETTLFDTTLGARSQNARKLSDKHLSIHQVLCDTYLMNWSPCIRDQSKVQEEINDNVQTADLKNGSLESDFRLTQQLRFQKNAAATNRLLCQDNIAVLDELRKVFVTSEAELQWLEINKAKAAARCNSLFLLQERIQNDLDLLEHAATQRDSKINYHIQKINYHNQKTAAKLNETLLALTYNTVDDSATIKIITIFTLIFLPGSFIATIFGMNFFVFEGGTTGPSNNTSNSSGSTVGLQDSTWKGLIIGQNFWIFIATWLPLTALVLLIYISVIWRRRRIVKKRRLAANTVTTSEDEHEKREMTCV